MADIIALIDVILAMQEHEMRSVHRISSSTANELIWAKHRERGRCVEATDHALYILARPWFLRVRRTGVSNSGAVDGLQEMRSLVWLCGAEFLGF